jgi:aspartyl aminopeptidase
MTLSVTGVNTNKVLQHSFQAKNKEIKLNQAAINNIQAKANTNLLHVYFTGKAKKPETILGTATPQEKQAIQAFGQEYMTFLEKTKSNLEAAKEVIKTAKANGYKPFDPESQVKPGDKVYFVNNDRAVVLATIGEKPVTSGIKLVGSHLDSPHITLKAKPLKDSEGYCLFKTMMHGLGSKRYQWVNRHLALEGKVITGDGREVNINIGNKPGESTFVISDLAPHVDSGNNKSKEFEAENMNPIVAMNSDVEGEISDYVEKVLKERYNISRDDLIHAELNLVPAENPRGVGFDQGLIGAYGHDDKSCVFASLKAEIEQKETPKFTTVAAFFGNEEIGSWNNYGAKSDFFKQAIGSLIEAQKGNYNENDLRRAFKKSLALSADVSTAVDPVDPSREEKTNACRLGHGVIMKLQGWKNSLPEATASVTRVFDRNNIKYQPFAYNQDVGGGATIGMYLATNLNMDVVDIGIPILSMHAPVEIADKGDLFHLYKGISAFLNNDKIKEVPYSLH